MALGPAPDWQRISWMVGNYNGEPILVTVDGLGQLSGGLGAYKDRYAQNIYGTSTGLSVTVDTPLVPAGEVWVISNISVWHDDPTSRRVTTYLANGPTHPIISRNGFLLQYEVMDRQGQWVLKEGDFIRAIFSFPASGKICTLGVLGYKTEVPT